MERFCNDLTGNTINRSFNEFRVKISKSSIEELSKEFGAFKLDESYLEVCRIRGKEGDEPLAKTKRKGVRNGRTELFKRGSDACNSRQNIEKFDNSYRNQNEFALGKSHVNGIECF